MTFKTSYLFWLLVAIAVGAWPLAMPTAHSLVSQQTTIAASNNA